VSRLGIGSGYGVPSYAVEKAFHEYGVNYFFWSSPRRKGMKEAIQHMARSERAKLIVAIQTYDHQGFLMKYFVEKGLRSLNIDYADVLVLGWFNHIPGRRVLSEALRLREEGKVRYLGMSGHNRTVFGEMARQAGCQIDIYMIRYNAVHRGAETDVFPHLPGEKRPGIVTYTATCWRKLLKAGAMPMGEHPLTSTDCYRFVLSNPNVNVCLTGPRNLKEMEEALLTLDKEPLTREEMNRMRRIGEFIHK
jgi:aryl-alcohol dehydrogenase-like predicted oxidoreductase